MIWLSFLKITIRPIVWRGDTVISSFPVPFVINDSWCLILIGMATLLCELMRYDINRKFPSGGMKLNIRSDCKMEIHTWLHWPLTYVCHVSHLPSFESYTWMKRSIIKHSRIHKRHAQIRHSRELDYTIDLKLSLKVQLKDRWFLY